MGSLHLGDGPRTNLLVWLTRRAAPVIVLAAGFLLAGAFRSAWLLQFGGTVTVLLALLKRDRDSKRGTPWQRTNGWLKDLRKVFDWPSEATVLVPASLFQGQVTMRAALTVGEQTLEERIFELEASSKTFRHDVGALRQELERYRRFDAETRTQLGKIDDRIERIQTEWLDYEYVGAFWLLVGLLLQALS